MDFGATLILTVLLDGQERTRTEEFRSVPECERYAAAVKTFMPDDMKLVRWTCQKYVQRDIPPK
ncbi:MAG: hypothetical protein K2Y42_09245 [Hyphomicrobium sp.]|nr:hypothetical protein [Hyphomicrobium sp.]